MSIVSIEFQIDSSGTITVPTPDPIETAPGAYLLFVIENNHDTKHIVTISPSEFEKKHSEPPHPIHSVATDSADIEPGDIGVILLHVKGKGHFKDTGKDKKAKKPAGASTKTFSYKYTIRASGGVPVLDPDIEINN